MKRIVSLVFALLTIMLISTAFASVTGGNVLAIGAGLTVLAAFIPQMPGVAYSTPTTEIAAIAKWAGLYSKQFLGQMLNGLDIYKDLAVDRMVSRHGKLLPKFTAQGGLRPLNTNIESNGGTERTWSGRKLFVYDAMKVFTIIPDDLITSFQSDMLAPGATQIPFAQWVWMKEMEKLASEINDNFYFADYAGDATAWDSGEDYTYSASAPQYFTFGSLEDIYKLVATTTAGQSPSTHPAKWLKVNSLAIATGPGTIIADEIAATNLSVVSAASGSVSSSNILDKIEAMYNSMTVAHRNKGGLVRLSPDLYRKYLIHTKSAYPMELGKDSGDGKMYVWGSGKKWEVRECTWMGSSQRIIMTQFDNMIVGTNIAQTPGITKTVETLHGYKSVAKFLIGSEIADLENLYVNDQA
jgi:hypothetical protein